MKRIGILAALLLLGPTFDTTSKTSVLADTSHGNYVPPYDENDPSKDPEYDHYTDEDQKAYKPRHCNILALSDVQSIGPYQAGVIKELVT